MTYIGHDQAWSEWRNALAGARMHHAWIIAGRRGIGKMGFALEAARELVAPGEGVGSLDKHPDVIVLSHLPASAEDERKREEGKPYQLRRNITVDQVRQVQRRLTTRPTLGSNRAIIIDPADDLERSASNALLKSLEEPPAGSYFLLVCHSPGRLLPTIRSRCSILHIAKPGDEEIDAIIRREMPHTDAAARSAAVAAAQGSPGIALQFIEQDLGPLHALMQTIAREGDPGFELRGALVEAMGARPDRDKLLAAVGLARSVTASAMGQVTRASIPALTGAYGELDRLAGQVPMYNFDPGLLMNEIGTLLASIALRRDARHG